MADIKVVLSRRNLLALLSKLDRNREQPDSSSCSLIKNDNQHPNPELNQSHNSIEIVAVEDEDYYVDRQPGVLHPADLPNVER